MLPLLPRRCYPWRTTLNTCLPSHGLPTPWVGGLNMPIMGASLPLYVTGCGNNVIFLFLTILTMLWCFPGLGMADKSCSEHIAGTMGAHWGTFSRYWCLWVVFGVSEGASNCDFPMWQWNNVIFLFFAILTMLCCFPGLGMADKSCSRHIAGTLGVH